MWAGRAQPRAALARLPAPHSLRSARRAARLAQLRSAVFSTGSNVQAHRDRALHRIPDRRVPEVRWKGRPQRHPLQDRVPVLYEHRAGCLHKGTAPGPPAPTPNTLRVTALGRRARDKGSAAAPLPPTPAPASFHSRQGAGQAASPGPT